MTPTFSTGSGEQPAPLLTSDLGVIKEISRASQLVEIQWGKGLASEIPLDALGPVAASSLWQGARLARVEIPVDNLGGREVLYVLEPEYVMDVTEVAEVAAGSRLLPEVAVLHRLGSRLPTRPMMSGTLLNSAFDLLVAQPDLTDSEVLSLACAGRPLAWAMLAHQGEDIADLLAEAQSVMPRLRAAIASWGTSEVLVEPYVVSPVFGLQGRFDIVVNKEGASHLIEMKGGKAPSRGIRPSHSAQVASYALLFLAQEGRWPDETSLWYVNAEKAAFRKVDSDLLLPTMHNVIKARNAIVAADYGLAHRDLGILRRLTPDLDGWSTYDRVEASNFADRYAGADTISRTMFQAWTSYLHRERWEQRIGTSASRSRASLWQATSEEKRDDPACITDMSLSAEDSDFDRMHLHFKTQRPIGDCSLRRGDMVVLHSGVPTDRSALQILKATLESINVDSVRVSLRNKQASRTALEATAWTVEADVSDASTRNLMAGTASLLDADPDHSSVLLGKRPPLFGPTHPVAAPSLTDDQRTVIERALACQDYFLIQGPPGTGKTNVILSTLVSQLLNNPDERLIVAAYTNRAVNEICAALDRVLPKGSYARHGTAHGAEGASPESSLPVMGSHLTPVQLATRVKNCRCIVSTIHSLHSSPEVFAFGNFTTALVDEASQVLEPQLMALLLAVRRTILIGDHFQLPAVVTQAEDALRLQSSVLAELQFTDLGMTTFERLYRQCTAMGWQGALATLSAQGRMHQDVMQFPSAAFYKGTLKTISEWQLDPSPLPWHHILPSRAAYIPVTDTPQAAAEASVVVDLVREIHESAAKAGREITIGVITPFRVQNRAISLELPPDLRSIVTVDTVERFQGSQRDVIIFSATVANSVELRNIRSDVELEGRTIDRKLNVACTRAREQFVLVGNPDVLKQAPVYADALTVLTWVYGS